MGVTDGRILIITSTTRCKHHQAPVDVPCWTLPSQDGRRESWAICGTRVKKAGFNGGTPALVKQKTPSGLLK